MNIIFSAIVLIFLAWMMVWIFVTAYSGIVKRKFSLPNLRERYEFWYLDKKTVKEIHSFTGLQALLGGLFFLFVGAVLFITFFWPILRRIFSIE